MSPPADRREQPARLPDISIADRALARRLVAEVGVEPGALFIGSAELAAIVARARRCGERLATARMLQIRHCRICGCTRTTACMTVVDGKWTPCAWAGPELCDACTPHLDAIADAGAEGGR